MVGWVGENGVGQEGFGVWCKSVILSGIIIIGQVERVTFKDMKGEWE